MARTTSLTKRSLISKANSTIVVATALSAFILVVGLVAGRSLVGQLLYQNRVIDAKKEALAQLRHNLDAVDSLEESYQDFVEKNPNVLAGSPDGAGPMDGDNAKIVLDALPSKYDFPALTSSLEKLITDQNLAFVGMTGNDEEVAQQEAQSATNPQPVVIPFEVQVTGQYGSIRNLVDVLRLSIRPFKIQNLELSGAESNMIVSIRAETYYQPAKDLTIETKVVR